MDTLLLESDEKLLDVINFTNPISANYITSKRLATFGPESGSSYSPTTGARLMRFKLGASNWLQPNSVSVQFTITVGSTNTAFMPQVHSFFRRGRLLSKGQLVSDITEFNRVTELTHLQLPKNKKDDLDALGFPTPKGVGSNIKYDVAGSYAGLGTAATSTMTVSFKPDFGLFKQNLLLPLQYLDLVLELELAGATDPIISLAGDHTNFINDPVHDVAGDWTVINPMVKCNLLTLDNNVENRIISRLLSGKSLHIPFEGVTSSLQTMTSNDVQINVSRSLSRLKKILVSYDTNIPAAAANNRGKYYNKQWNAFWAPRNSTDVLTADPSTLYNTSLQKLQISIGSHQFPEYPVASVSEARDHFLECCPMGESAVSTYDYYNDSFVFGVNLEKSHEVGFSGLNIKNMPVIVHSKTSQIPDRIHIVMYYDSILEINDTSISVYD